MAAQAEKRKVSAARLDRDNNNRRYFSVDYKRDDNTGILYSVFVYGSDAAYRRPYFSQ